MSDIERYIVLVFAVLALAGCVPKTEPVITDTAAFTEWTMPNRVVIVPPPYCEAEYRAFVRFHPRAQPFARLAAAWRVIRCYREGYEWL